MTALTLPRTLPGRKQQSKPVTLAKGVAKTWTSMKLGSIAAKTAKKAGKAYGSWKVTAFLGKRTGKVLLVPVAVGGGVAAWRTLRSSSDDGSPVTQTDSAATPQTVAAPKTAPGSPNGETATASNDPAVPPGATS